MEYSFGVIPFSFFGKEMKFFLLQHQSGHWAFPKGKRERDETPLMTAERELYEECGLQIVKWLRDEPFTERYHFQRGKSLIDKEVSYYPAIVLGKVTLQTSEIKDGAWFSFQEGERKATFPEMKKIIREAEAWADNTSFG